MGTLRGMWHDILDAKRKAVLPFLRPLKQKFYLGGGTGLALQLGHRESIDFDFFSDEHVEPERVYRELARDMRGHILVRTMEEEDTLYVIFDGSVKMSFLWYPYPLLEPCIEDENVRIASVTDIACMKLSAVIDRAVTKDFVDLYYILRDIPLATLLEKSKQKFPAIDQNLILKSLVYFDDVRDEGVIFRPGYEVAFAEVKKFLEQQVKNVVYCPES